eukprot:746026-Hanusia_phi.AAC.2
MKDGVCFRTAKTTAREEAGWRRRGVGGDGRRSFDLRTRRGEEVGGRGRKTGNPITGWVVLTRGTEKWGTNKKVGSEKRTGTKVVNFRDELEVVSRSFEKDSYGGPGCRGRARDQTCRQGAAAAMLEEDGGGEGGEGGRAELRLC